MSESATQQTSSQSNPTQNSDQKLSFDAFRDQVLADYRLGWMSREASLLGRKQVLTGKAKFGIFGDGKELAQLAMAKTFQRGDYKAGYYRDQTFMFAQGVATVQEFFAQMYAHADLEHDPFSGGRQMNAHFATPFLDEDGKWLDLRERYNVSADVSPTASQMSRALGLALASKCYRANPDLKEGSHFSRNGDEVSFVTIGDASTSEGIFWESVNAAGVQRVPLAIFVWDDGYGISVPVEYQTVKGSISEALAGMQAGEDGRGLDIYTVKGWDYPALCDTFERGIARVRETHIPAIFHVKEVTQPQGHSTSGSHERYKSAERLQWEQDFDGLVTMKDWMIATGLATEQELEAIAEEARQEARAAQKSALKAAEAAIKSDVEEALGVLDGLAMESPNGEAVRTIRQELAGKYDPSRRDAFRAVRSAIYATRGETGQGRRNLTAWLNRHNEINNQRFSSHLLSESDDSPMRQHSVSPVFNEESKTVQGFELLNACFRANFERDPAVYAFGEDLGQIGGVNQGFAGLQQVFGTARIFDTGIREATIMGQGLGMAMRGLRPIAEIQYLDYLIYGLQPLTDDLATLHYRTVGRQKAPMIVRTRGHRFEGIWHTGSPIGMILNSIRGMHFCVPRNMTQAAGFYNLLLRSDDPGLIIECLNGYRLKEKMPENVGDFTVPLGQPETLVEGEDLTIVTYGSCVRIAEDAIERLAEMDINAELLDVQTLLPFDVDHRISESLEKTNRVIFLDEDVPGGASAFMMQQVLDVQGAYKWLDSAPVAVSARPHRSPYGSDGDYFAKPNAEDVIEAAYKLMHDADPQSWPAL